MSAQHKEPYDVIVKFLCNISHGKEVVKRFAHFTVVHIYVTVMKPVVRKGYTVCRLALCNLVFVVRKDKILTARMYVNGFAQILIDHCTALNVPAGSALAPGTLPGRFTLFFCLPDGKIHRVLFMCADFYSRTGFKIFKRLVREFAVILKLFNTEVNVAVHIVGIALFNQLIYYSDNCVNVFRCLGVHGCLFYSQTVSVRKILSYEPVGKLFYGYSLLVGTLNHFVVNISKILYEVNFIPPVFKVPSERVKDYKRACVSYVKVVVNRRTAGIHLNLARLNGYKIFFFSRESIV